MFGKLTKIFLLALLPVSIGNAEEGKWRIVNYWSEWCAPCRVEIPMFNSLSEELADKNISIVGVNFDEDPRGITLEIAEELGVIFPPLTMAQVEELALRPPDVMPTTYILTPENKVATKLIGMQKKEDILEELVKLGIEI
ncbi:MAG: peroxiredoxin [Gammaproteobacteria bacterium]|nr:peroxiredoxin [Gammaproteobacteria bacterium]